MCEQMPAAGLYMQCAEGDMREAITVASHSGSQRAVGLPQVVQCRLGTEREMVISLLQKYNDMAAAGTPLGIKSAFCHDHLSVRASRPLHP